MASFKVGIAGYMGSGKTTCSQILVDAGARLINADLEAKIMMESEPEIVPKLLNEFGDSIFEQGKLSYARLGSIVFSSVELLKKLNSVVHPPLLKRLKRLLSVQEKAIIVLDAALIPLWDIDSWFDLRVWVDASQQKRLERMAKRVPNLKKEQLQYRLTMQENLFSPPPVRTWKYISNNESIELFNQKVFSLMEQILNRI